MKEYVSWKIGGEAGFGIISAGTMLVKAFARRGYHAIAANEYPSLIRGGHNVITVGISTQPFEALNKTLDILIALNKETITLHKDELHDGSYIVYDPKDQLLQASDFPVSVHLISLPLTEIVQAVQEGDAIMRNTVALGATIALLGADFSVLTDVIQTQFEKKGPKVIEGNTTLAKAGFDGIEKEYAQLDAYHLSQPKNKKEYLIMNASEAVGIGAIDGGLKFAAIYPMTPINALITLFADHKKDLGITYIQPEDEIAGITMAIGASIAGVRSMVATSGGGYALMVEGVSLSGITEVPVVIDLGMRPGPATGMPTYTEQGELLFAMFSGHGDFSRIILSPGDIVESYQLSKRAFDEAQTYQTPVFILTDKYLNENQWCVDAQVFDAPPSPIDGKRATPVALSKDFKRYDTTVTDGVSPRSFPGTEGGIFITNSYEHDERGLTTEDASMRIQMVDKRARKQKTIIANAPLPTRYGDADSQLTFVSFGSTKGPILEAMKLLKEKGITSALLHFSWVYPLDGKKIKALLEREKRIIDVEQNSTGQFAKYLMMETGIEIKEKLLKYDGRQWSQEEIVEKLLNQTNLTNPTNE